MRLFFTFVKILILSEKMPLLKDLKLISFHPSTFCSQHHVDTTAPLCFWAQNSRRLCSADILWSSCGSLGFLKRTKCLFLSHLSPQMIYTETAAHTLSPLASQHWIQRSVLCRLIWSDWSKKVLSSVFNWPETPQRSAVKCHRSNRRSHYCLAAV